MPEHAHALWQQLSLKAVVDDLPDMVFRARVDGTIIYANQAYLDFHGLPAEEVIGRSFVDLSPPEERDVIQTVLLELQQLTPERPTRRNEHETRTVSGAPSWHEWSDQAIFDGDELLGFVSVGRDVTRQRLQQARAAFHLIHDSLTGLRNRRGLFRHLEGLLEEEWVPDIGVLYLDLNGFKAVNDTLGHRVGDMALVGCADVLRAASGPRDLVCRLGGDEFVVVTAGPDGGAQADALVPALRDALAGLPHPLGASIGRSVPREGDTPATLLERADASMYAEKRSSSR